MQKVGKGLIGMMVLAAGLASRVVSADSIRFNDRDETRPVFMEIMATVQSNNITCGIENCAGNVVTLQPEEMIQLAWVLTEPGDPTLGEPTLGEPTVVSDIFTLSVAANSRVQTICFASDPQACPTTGFTVFTLAEAVGGNDLITTPNNNLTWGVKSDIPGVPEPSTCILLATGLVGLLGYGWRQRKKTAQV